MMQSPATHSDPVSRAISALRDQASTTGGKSSLPRSARKSSARKSARKSPYMANRSCDYGTSLEHAFEQEAGDSSALPIHVHTPSKSSKKRVSKTPASSRANRVKFSPKLPTVHRQESSRVSPKAYIRSPDLRRLMSPSDVYDCHGHDYTSTPLPISPSSTCKRAVCEQMEQYNKDYRDAIKEQEIQYMARIRSVRKIFGLTVALFVLYLVLGVVYYSKYSSGEEKWPIHESLVFLIYTASTVGYGNHNIPSEPIDRVVTIIFIMVGIGLVTVFLSEIFQYITIETEKARFTHEERKIRMRAPSYGDVLFNGHVEDEENQHNVGDPPSAFTRAQKLRSAVFDSYASVRYFLERSASGRLFIKLIPFIFFIVLGASVVGTIEKWTWIDSFYWAIVTLTTVGYGDLAPSKPESIWFCIFFLPTSTVFLSLYLSKVAGAYMRLHVEQIHRIEHRLQSKHNRDSEKDQWADLGLVPSGETDELSPTGDDAYLRKSPEIDSCFIGEDGGPLPYIIQQTPSKSEVKPRGRALSMRDLLRSTKTSKDNQSSRNLFSDASPTPSLVLRARVQERLAYIISTDLSTEVPTVEIRENDVHLILNDWKATVEKWMIPKKAKEPFKSASCEIILSIGANVIQERGVDALLELNTSKFQRQFNPVIAAFGPADCLEGWMISTDHLVQKVSKE